MTYSEGEGDAHQEGNDQVDVLHGGRLLIGDGNELLVGWYAEMEVLCKGCRRWVEGLRIQKELAVLSIRVPWPPDK